MIPKERSSTPNTITKNYAVDKNEKHDVFSVVNYE